MGLNAQMRRKGAAPPAQLRTYAASLGYVVAREYVDGSSRPAAPCPVILVRTFSRFTRKRRPLHNPQMGCARVALTPALSPHKGRFFVCIRICRMQG